MSDLEICPKISLDKALSLYDAPGRYYHTREHGEQVASCALRIFNDSPNYAWPKYGHQLLKAAGLLHDCCQGEGHEFASAVVAIEVCPYADTQNKLAWLIIAGTAHDHGDLHERGLVADLFLAGSGLRPIPGHERDSLAHMAAALHDADVAGFAASEADVMRNAFALFREYVFKGRQIRSYGMKRYSFLNEIEQAAGRGLLLESADSQLTATMAVNLTRNLQIERDWLVKLYGVSLKAE